ncbi:MAG: helix-turn-helix transcriptional regulator [Rhodospirillales bacterium]|jgi:hypothetical protein
MNASDLRNALLELGLGQAQFARLIEVTPRAVSLWLAGEREIPGPVEAYLNLLSSLPKALFVKELARLKQEDTVMSDGMYGVEFIGNTGSGVAVLVFSGGTVFGADSGKVQYDGTYQPSPTNIEKVDVHLHLTVPPNTQLVQGVPPQPMAYGFDIDCSLAPRGGSELNVPTPFGIVKARVTFLRPLPN